MLMHNRARGSDNIMDAVLINDSLPDNLAEKYRLADSFPVKLDAENIKKIRS